MEAHFFSMMPSFFAVNEVKRNFHEDNLVKHFAESLAVIINELNLPEDGENNKYIGVMNLARAYVKFINAQFGNSTYMNSGSFWLICCRIALHVR